jgi:hypothetical protein
MRPVLALATVITVFGGIVLGGSRVLGAEEPVPADTIAGGTTSWPLGPIAERKHGSETRRTPTRETDADAPAALGAWRRRVNAACVSSMDVTAALTARVRGARKVDSMIEIGRLELANERRTIEEIAFQEPLHPQRRIAHQLTLAGRKYVRETERVLDFLTKRQLLDALEAAQTADIVRAQWGALAGRLSATRCGTRHDNLLVGLALDGIGG